MWPKIRSRKTIKISQWMELIEREVEFAEGAPPEIYHAVGQQDYIAILARTPEGKIPIVKQYRPALEKFTWELPAGMVEAGEDPAECCRRELLEETGMPAAKVHALGTYAPCTARLSNRLHSFFVETDARDPRQAVEAGIDVKLVSQAELAELIRAGEFVLQLHIGAIMLAGMRSFIDLGDFSGKKK